MVHGEFFQVQIEFDNLIDQAATEAGQQEFADRITPLLYQKDIVVWNAAASALEQHDRQVRVVHSVGTVSIGMNEFYPHSTGLLELRGMTSSPSVTAPADTAIDALRISSLTDIRNGAFAGLGEKFKPQKAQVIDKLGTQRQPLQTLCVQHLTVAPSKPSEAVDNPSHLISETYRPNSWIQRRFASSPKDRATADLTVKRVKDESNHPLLEGGSVILDRPTLPASKQPLRTREDVEQAVAEAWKEMESARILYEIIGALGQPLAELEAFQNTVIR